MITDHAMKPGYNYSEEFEFGLDLILDGVDRLRPASQGYGSERTGRSAR